MIKILDARYDMESKMVTVDIDVDGIKTSVGNIDPKWTKQEVLKYLDSIKPEIIKNAAPVVVFDKAKYIGE